MLELFSEGQDGAKGRRLHEESIREATKKMVQNERHAYGTTLNQCSRKRCKREGEKDIAS